jgi:hypothetical protein
MRQVVLLGLLVSLAFPFDGYAQYDMVAGSTRLEPTALSNGDSARKQTFQILPRRVARYKNYLATVIRDDQTGLVWFVYEGADSIQATQPTRNWIIAKSKDNQSLVGFQAVSSMLIFRVSSRIAGSLDSAPSVAMTELSAEIALAETDPGNPLYSPQISLRRHLDISTFSGAAGLLPRDIKQVTGIDGGWLVELASHPSVAKTAFVYRSEKFDVLKVDIRRN